MKQLFKTLLKHKLRLLFILASFLYSSQGIWCGNVVYLKVWSNWKNNSANLCVRYCGSSGNDCRQLTQIGSTGVYYADINSCTTFQFIRCNTSGCSKDNIWNKSNELTYTASANYWEQPELWDSWGSTGSSLSSIYAIRGLGDWNSDKNFDSSGNYDYTPNVNGVVEFKMKRSDTWYGNGQIVLPDGTTTTISGTTGGAPNCKLYVANGVKYRFHFEGFDNSGNPKISVSQVSGVDTQSSALYIKGPLCYFNNGCWNYSSSAYSVSSSVWTIPISASTQDCSSAQKEFVLSKSNSDDDSNILNGRYVFVPDGDNAGWTYSTRSGATHYFKCTLSYTAGNVLTLTLTWDDTNKRYKMKITSCTKPVAPTSDAATSKVTTSDVLCEGKSITLTAPTGFTGSPTSYVWNINGTDDDTQTGSTYTYTVPSSSFTAKVKGVNACGTSDNYSYETTFSSIIAKPTTTYNVGGGGTICSTGSTSITLDGSQSGFKYQLYKGDDPVEGKVIDGGGGELSFTGISASGTYYVYAYKSGSASCSFKMNGSTSSSASVTVVDPAAITGYTASSYQCEGASKNLSATGNASTTNYQWYKGESILTGETSSTLAISSVSETATYKCYPSNSTCGTGSAGSGTTITMVPNPGETSISGPATACKGQTSLSYTASSDAVAGSTYSYSWSVESGGWTRTSSATANPATFTAGTGASGTIGVTPTLTTSGKACAGSKVTKTVSTPNKTVTIKVEKKGVATSTAPYVFVWTEGIDTWSAAWPGNEMKDDPYNAGWWTADISVGRCIYQLIFSSGSTQTPDSEQITSDEKCFSFSANSWSNNKPEDNYADCPIACTPPTTQTVTASKAATCKNSSEYVTVASSQVGYTYELYYRISPADYASTGNTVEGTGSALKISTGKLTSTGTYDLQVKAFDTTTGGCVTVMNVSAAQITTSSVAGPALSISSASAKNFESVTVSSDVAATWAVSNKETVGGVDDSYISPTGTAANETTVFKGTVGSSSSSKDFLVTATSVAQSSCTSTLVVNVSKDAESCE